MAFWVLFICIPSVVCILIGEHSSLLGHHPLQMIINQHPDRSSTFLDKSPVSTFLIRGRGWASVPDRDGARVGCIENGLFYIRVGRTLLRGHETGTHVDAFRSQREGSYKSPGIYDPSSRDHGNLHCIDRLGYQTEGGELIKPAMTASLGTGDNNSIHTGLFGLPDMPDS